MMEICKVRSTEVCLQACPRCLRGDYALPAGDGQSGYRSTVPCDDVAPGSDEWPSKYSQCEARQTARIAALALGEGGG